MAAVIEDKCKSFITTMEKSAKELFKDYETTDKKKIIKKDDPKKDPKKKYEPVKVTFKISQNPDDDQRTGAEQAVIVARNSSWTCSSAHMADKARHVVPHLNGKRVEEPYTSFAPLMDDYKKKWVNAMGTDLVNCAGKKAYHKDQYHLELKDGKKGILAKETEACYVKYVDLTKDPKKRINTDFEASFKKKLTEIRNKKGIITEEELKRREALKNHRVSAEMTGNINVFRKAGAGKKTIKIPGSIMPGKSEDFGKRTESSLSVTKYHKSDTYADVTLSATISFILVAYEYVPQQYIDKIEMTFETRMSGLLAKAAAVTMNCGFKISLKKSKDVPTGEMRVPFYVDGLLMDDSKDEMIIKFDGLKVSLG